MQAGGRHGSDGGGQQCLQIELEQGTTGSFTTLDTRKFGVPGPLSNQALRKFSGVQFMLIKGLGLSQNLLVSSVVKHPV